jgi:hypothetical protein
MTFRHVALVFHPGNGQLDHLLLWTLIQSDRSGSQRVHGAQSAQFHFFELASPVR